MAGTRQGWYPDPFQRHESRYFSAGRATKLVRDGSVQGSDPPPPWVPEDVLAMNTNIEAAGRIGTVAPQRRPLVSSQNPGAKRGLADLSTLPRSVLVAVTVRGLVVAWLVIASFVRSSAHDSKGAATLLAVVAVAELGIYAALVRRIIYRPSKRLRRLFQVVNLIDVVAFITSASLVRHPHLVEPNAVPAAASVALLVLLSLRSTREYFDTPSLYWRGAYVLWAVVLLVALLTVVGAVVNHRSADTSKYHNYGPIDGTEYSLQIFGTVRMNLKTSGAITTSCTTTLPQNQQHTFAGDGEDVCSFNDAPIGAFIVNAATHTAHVKLADGATVQQIGEVDISQLIPGHQLLIVETHRQTVVGVTFR